MAGHGKWWARLAVSSAIMFSVFRTCHGQEDSRVDWTRKVVIQLKRHTRCPPDAVGQTGTAKVGFSIDRSGNLISTELIKSAGFPLLDAEALALVSRASPFPRPPAGDVLEDGKLKFVVPIEFATGPEDVALNRKLHSICRGC